MRLNLIKVKIMKFFLVCFLIIIGCKSGSKHIGTSNTVIGTAINTKGGAILRNDDETYKIEGLHSWNSIYLNKKVKVRGIFTFINGEDCKKNENPLLNSLQAQTLNINYYSVSKAVWELYTP
jgi:predicted transcriptional regulator